MRTILVLLAACLLLTTAVPGVAADPVDDESETPDLVGYALCLASFESGTVCMCAYLGPCPDGRGD